MPQSVLAHPHPHASLTMADRLALVSTPQMIRDVSGHFGAAG
jgi:hypothetical protein